MNTINHNEGYGFPAAVLAVLVFAQSCSHLENVSEERKVLVEHILDGGDFFAISRTMKGNSYPRILEICNINQDDITLNNERSITGCYYDYPMGLGNIFSDEYFHAMHEIDLDVLGTKEKLDHIESGGTLGCVGGKFFNQDNIATFSFHGGKNILYDKTENMPLYYPIRSCFVQKEKKEKTD